MRPPLHLVPPDEAAPVAAPSETVAQRVRRLQAEARQLAADHARDFAEGLDKMRAAAAEIHDGGEAFPAGVRSIARDVMQACESSALNLRAIMERQP